MNKQWIRLHELADEIGIDETLEILERVYSLADSSGCDNNWLPIGDAPRDVVVLVNDTTEHSSPWVAARWLENEQWSGWIYDDESTADAMPLGPCPTHYLVPPPLPLPLPNTK